MVVLAWRAVEAFAPAVVFASPKLSGQAQILRLLLRADADIDDGAEPLALDQRLPGQCLPCCLSTRFRKSWQPGGEADSDQAGNVALATPCCLWLGLSNPHRLAVDIGDSLGSDSSQILCDLGVLRAAVERPVPDVVFGIVLDRIDIDPGFYQKLDDPQVPPLARRSKRRFATGVPSVESGTVPDTEGHHCCVAIRGSVLKPLSRR